MCIIIIRHEQHGYLEATTAKQSYDVSSPRELSDFFAPLRLYPQPLNDVLTLNIIDQHFAFRKSTLRERPHTAITHMLVQAD